jgi:hypothetical protein
MVKKIDVEAVVLWENNHEKLMATWLQVGKSCKRKAKNICLIVKKNF